MSFVEILKTIIIGIVEGITEWLPISSTGHMILVNEWLSLNVTDQFMEMFLVVIQLGAILAVVVLFFNKLNPFALSKSKDEKIDTWNIWLKVIIGILPAAVIGLLFDDWREGAPFILASIFSGIIVIGATALYIQDTSKTPEREVRSISLYYK